MTLATISSERPSPLNMESNHDKGIGCTGGQSLITNPAATVIFQAEALVGGAAAGFVPTLRAGFHEVDQGRVV